MQLNNIRKVIGNLSLTLLTVLTIESCSLFQPRIAPPRDFEVTLYVIDWETKCLVSKKRTICEDDPNFKHYIAILIDDYKKERDYQDQIKDSCDL